MSGAEKKPKIPRGDALPTEGYGLSVDGKIKSRHATSEAALKAGLEIKRNFPVVQVTLFDAAAGTRTTVESPEEAAEL
jgi:hypothetical protein